MCVHVSTMCEHVCVCMCTTHVCTCVCVHACGCTRVCVCTSQHMCAHMCMCAHVQCMCAHPNARVHVCTCVCTHVCMCLHVYAPHREPGVPRSPAQRRVPELMSFPACPHSQPACLRSRASSTSEGSITEEGPQGTSLPRDPEPAPAWAQQGLFPAVDFDSGLIWIFKHN